MISVTSMCDDGHRVMSPPSYPQFPETHGLSKIRSHLVLHRALHGKQGKHNSADHLASGVTL